MEEKRPILIQGSMKIEVEYLIKQISNIKKDIIKGYEFYKGELDGYPVVISKTAIGEISMCIATMLGITSYSPIAIIVQGTAGAHDLNLKRHDIVVGTKCININSFETQSRKKEEGSNSLNWKLKEFKEQNDDLIENYSSKDLIEIAKKIENKYKKGKVVYGVLGSGDGWNKEWDRIDWINKMYNTLCEDMESISTYTICNKFNIPVIGIRVISNNERIIEETYNRTSAIDSQEFTIEMVKEYIRRIKCKL